MAWGLAAAIACAYGGAVPARAQPIFELRHDLRVDGILAGVGAAGWITSEMLKSRLAPASCRWCDRDTSGRDTLNGVDRAVRGALRWSDTHTAHFWSNLIGFGMVPATAFGLTALGAGLDSNLRGFGVDALIIAEAMVAAVVLNQLVKFLVGRERPFVHALSAAEKGKTEQPSDNNLSFFSGHTTFTFSLAVAAGTVASLRGYRWAPAVWSVAVPLAALTGYLRIAADKHYFTDVLVGMLVGGTLGFVIPYFAHGRQDAGTRQLAQPNRGRFPLMVGWMW